MNRNEIRTKFVKLSAKIQKNPYINAISSGLSATMPMLIAGAMFTLLSIIPLDAYQNFLKNSGIINLLNIVPKITTDIIALYAVFTISYNLAKYKEVDGLTTGVLSLLSFFAVTPLAQLKDETLGFSLTWFGARGLFVAMFVAIISTNIYAIILKKRFYIRMPQGVPPSIEKSMGALVPAFILLALFLTITGCFNAMGYDSVHVFVFKFLQKPLTHLGGSWIAFLIVNLMIGVFWMFGVHGGLVVLSVMSPVYTPLRLENLAAFQAGQAIPNLIAGTPSYLIYGALGGGGATIGLAIAMLFAKSAQYKTLGKLSIIPSICNINEPLMFGMPIVLNFRLAIPYILTPIITSACGVFLTAVNILPKLRGIGTPTGTPIILRGFIEGGFRVAIFQLAMIAVSFLIYYPFFKKMDKEAYENEQKVS